MNTTTLYNPGAESPFDAIKQTRTDGSEYWSARDLMEKLGYDQWRNFEAAIERAKMTAVNQGMSLDALFAGVSKKSFMGRPKADIELSRYAAYLVSLNGDPRKPEVASAQSYFAIQTRVAETQKPQAELTRKEILLMALEAEEHADKAEAKVVELEPSATAYGHWRDDGETSWTFRELSKKLIEQYPGMNEEKLREHMLKRRELGKSYYWSKKQNDWISRYAPNTEMMRKGWATERMTPNRSGRPVPAYKYTPAYYEELVKRFSKTLTPAGQQEILEIA